MSTERKISMNYDMVMSMLRETKTETRRLFKMMEDDRDQLLGVFPPESYNQSLYPLGMATSYMAAFEGRDCKPYWIACPYGTCGDILVVEEYPSLRRRITDIRVERLHSITDVGAVNEGVTRYSTSRWRNYQAVDGVYTYPVPMASFMSLWDSIHGDGAWDASNPWVWVISFTRANVN